MPDATRPSFVDSHCHLSFPELLERLPEVREAMREAGVEQALCICTTMEEFGRVHGLALQYNNFWASVGVHPDNEDVLEPSIEDLVAAAGLPRVVAIGETGLDYYRLGERSLDAMEWQRERFRVHIRAARQVGKPLIVHTRSSAADTVRILAEEGAEAVGGVFHCFTDTWETARAALDLGFHISFSGILTFKNAQDIRDVARQVPIERCLIETDSPYLAPVPYRGKLNTPAYVAHVGAHLAQVKDLPLAVVAAQTTANFRALFGIPAPGLG